MLYIYTSVNRTTTGVTINIGKNCTYQYNNCNTYSNLCIMLKIYLSVGLMYRKKININVTNLITYLGYKSRFELFGVVLPTFTFFPAHCGITISRSFNWDVFCLHKIVGEVLVWMVALGIWIKNLMYGLHGQVVVIAFTLWVQYWGIPCVAL